MKFEKLCTGKKIINKVNGKSAEWKKTSAPVSYAYDKGQVSKTNDKNFTNKISNLLNKETQANSQNSHFPKEVQIHKESVEVFSHHRSINQDYQNHTET